MTAETRNLVVTLTPAALTSLQASVAQFALIVADVDSAGDLNRRDIARSLTIQLGAAVASFDEQITAAESDNNSTSGLAVRGAFLFCPKARFCPDICPASPGHSSQIVGNAGAARED